MHVLSKTISHPPSPGLDRHSPCGHLSSSFWTFNLQWHFITIWHWYLNHLTCTAYQWFWLAHQYFTLNTSICLFREFKTLLQMIIKILALLCLIIPFLNYIKFNLFNDVLLNMKKITPLLGSKRRQLNQYPRLF